MSKLRVVTLCLTCAGLLVVPAAADAQKQRPGGDKRQQTSPRCRAATLQSDRAAQQVKGEQADVAKARKAVSKRKKAYKNSKTKGNKRKLRKAKAKLKAEKTELRLTKARANALARRKAQMCS